MHISIGVRMKWEEEDYWRWFGGGVRGIILEVVWWRGERNNIGGGLVEGGEKYY